MAKRTLNRFPATRIFFSACVLLSLFCLSLGEVRAAACAQLAVLPGEAETHERAYLEASCYIERRDYRQAIPLLESLVSHDPWPVYQAELGRAYLGAQEFEQARKSFRQALAADPPESARRLLVIYLRLAEDEQLQAKDWFGTASVAWVHDTNINAGPRSQEVTLYGLPFTLAENGMPKSDQGARVILSGVHAKALTEVLAWQTALSFETLNYRRYHQYDTQQINLESGPRLDSADGNWGLYLPVAVGQSWLGGNPYSRQYGVLPQLRRIWGERGLGTAGVFYQQTDYLNAPAMSSHSASLYFAWRQNLSKQWSLEASARHVDESAQDEAYANRRNSVGLMLKGSLLGQWRLSAESNLTQAKYLAAEFWAERARRDLRLVQQLAISRDLAGGYYFALSWVAWHTRSNLDLYRSHREQLQIQLSKAF